MNSLKILQNEFMDSISSGLIKMLS